MERQRWKTAIQTTDKTSELYTTAIDTLLAVKQTQIFQLKNGVNKLLLTLTLHISSFAQLNFICHLVTCLNSSPHWDVSVQLHTCKSTRSPLLATNTQEDKHLLTYSQIVPNMQATMLNELKQQFSKKCVDMHELLNNLKGKYSLPNRLTFWTKKMNDFLIVKASSLTPLVKTINHSQERMVQEKQEKKPN